MSPPVTIIGTGVAPADLTGRQRSVIESADVLVGGKRLLAPFDGLGCEQVVIDKNLTMLGDVIESRMVDRTVVVLTSGDPLFFGIGAFLVRRLGTERVRILPNVSAVATAFARLGEPWQDVRVVSLHGRSHTGPLLRYLAAGETVAVYTDPGHDPAWLARLLTNNRFDDVGLTVLEQLGTPLERIIRTTPAEAQESTFAALNLVVLKPDPDRLTAPPLFPGMPDDWFDHEKGLITKSEVRAVSLSRLRLFDRAVFWDLGAGSGSIAIEAGQFITRGRIFAVEQNPSRIARIRENRARFGVGNITVLEARLPRGLDGLPDPDRVFIGGGGEHLSSIIGVAADRLAADGIIVVNTVLIDNLAAARRTLFKLGFEVDLIQIQVSRGKPMPYSQRFEAANPVWIITGRRCT